MAFSEQPIFVLDNLCKNGWHVFNKNMHDQKVALSKG